MQPILNLLYLSLFLSSVLIVPLIIYMIGFALQSDKVQRFSVGVAKVLLVLIVWFFFCVMGGNFVDFIVPHKETGELVLASMAIVTLLYSCLIVGLYRRGRISFFKGASC